MLTNLRTIRSVRDLRDNPIEYDNIVYYEDFSVGLSDWVPIRSNHQILDIDPPTGYSNYLRSTGTIENFDRSELGLTLKQGNTYKFSGWFRSNRDGDQEISTWFNAVVATIPLDNTDWHYIERTFTALGDGVLFRVYSNRQNGSWQAGDYFEMTGIKIEELEDLPEYIFCTNEGEPIATNEGEVLIFKQ